MFTDTHCHIYGEYYNDIDNILKISSNNQVNKFINNGCDTNTNNEVLNLISIYDNMYGALGIHPEYVDRYSKEDIEFIKNHLDNEKIIAIGEIGLDYHYTKEKKLEQIKLFESMLKLAEENNIPVIVHSRDATLDTINTLKKFKVKGVIHSFSGSLETAKEYLKMGFLLGINGVITFKNSNLKEVIKEISLDNIILETDSPYLTPEPFRGKQNNPSHILDIAKFIADLKNITLDELSYVINDNVKRMFDI